MSLSTLAHPKLKPGATVVVGMSGGVDSSVSAAILKDMGYNVIGMFMRNWDETSEDGICTATEDFEDVVKVATKIGIPYYTVNFTEEYRSDVFDKFLEELKKGNTPNPDILCNKEIKFKLFLDTALKLGADVLATGHYAQNHYDGSIFHLMKGRDPGKDQTYFLYTIEQQSLSQVIFPVGGLEKAQVRSIAKDLGLATAEKKDSTGICFIGERNFKKFLNNYLAYTPGPFKRLNGIEVGKHCGVAYYTIGQRRGLGIGGQGEAWFVVGKDVEKNIVFVEQGSLHPALFSDNLTASEPHWIAHIPHNIPFDCAAKIRYRQPDQKCTIVKNDKGELKVEFQIPQRAITPKQSIVFYKDNECIGGATIEKAGPTYYDMQKSLPQEVSP